MTMGKSNLRSFRLSDEKFELLKENSEKISLPVSQVLIKLIDLFNSGYIDLEKECSNSVDTGSNDKLVSFIDARFQELLAPVIERIEKLEVSNNSVDTVSNNSMDVVSNKTVDTVSNNSVDTGSNNSVNTEAESYTQSGLAALLFNHKDGSFLSRKKKEMSETDFLQWLSASDPRRRKWELVGKRYWGIVKE
jgi:hypothetical protein